MRNFTFLLFGCICFSSFGQMTQGTAETYHHGTRDINTFLYNNKYKLSDVNNFFIVKTSNTFPTIFGESLQELTDADNNWEQKNTLEFIKIDNLNIDEVEDLYFIIYENGNKLYNSNTNIGSPPIVTNQEFKFSGIQTDASTLSVTFFYDDGNLGPDTEFTSFSLVSTSYNITNIEQDGISINYKFRLENNFATDILYGLQSTSSFYNSKFNRLYDFNSFSILKANLYRGLDDNDYSNNALSSTFLNKMIFGAGYFDFRKPNTALEVVAHEYTHFILARENKFQKLLIGDSPPFYFTEIRALNESVCDAFGVIIKHYINKIDNPNAEINWVINDFGLGSNANDILRDMSDPSNVNMIHNYPNGGENDSRQTNTYGFVHPDTYINGTSILQGPNWVHEFYGFGEKASYKNMGPANYWFYLIANEDYMTNPKVSVNDAGTNYSVKSFGIEKAQQLLYYLITDSPDLNRFSKYEEYKNASINAADYFVNNGLHNFNQNDVQSIKDAWHAVGVLDNPNEFCNAGALITDGSGIIQDGSLSQDYNNNQNCSWLIQPTNTTSVTIDFSEFDVASGDSLTIYDGIDNNASPLTYTGNSLPPSFTSTTGAVFIEFNTDASITGLGWSLNYSSQTTPEYCDTLTVLYDSIATFDDGSGTDNYGNNANCSWLIQPENATYIDINFLSLDLENGLDFVSVYDGPNAETGTLLDTFTGTTLPSTITATSGQAFIKFTSNHINVQQGWEISYTSDGIQPCTGTTILNSSSGTVSDGSGTDNYGNNANCSWLIQPTDATSITLIFDELNLQEPGSDGFVFDYLEIYDGNDDSGEPLVSYTDEQFLPIIVQSSGGALFVKFVTDNSITESGWQFTYTSSTTDYCSGTTFLDSASGTISDGSGSNNYNSNSDCRWLIRPENATSIELTFSAFNTELGQDGVVVYDGTDTSFPYTAYSGSNLPNTIYSTGGAMLVRFLSDAQNEFEGFEASYVANIAPEGNPNSVVSYQYWFNDDYANVTSLSDFGPVNTLNLTIQSNTSNLSNGLNTLHIRAKDRIGYWSSILSEFVYVQNTSNTANNLVAEYEYWFDDNYVGRIVGNGTDSNPLVLDLTDNVGLLETGLHQFHIRFKDKKGVWSSIVSEFIYNNKPIGLGNNKISTYRHWFNDDFVGRTSGTFTPEETIIFLEDIDVSGLAVNSTNYIHFQFKDIYGNWSSVLSEEFLYEALVLNPTVFLQGSLINPFVGEENLMRDDLRMADLLPITSPYADGKMTTSNVLDVTGTDAIVDWVWVELRDATDRTVVVEGRSALLQRDGDVVDVDGTSGVSFHSSVGNYYVLVNHRNHLGVMTANLVSLSATTTTVDLSADPSQVLGGTNAVIDMGAGIFAMYGGDFNGDGQILNIDITAVLLLTGTSGYSNGDADLDGQILNTDIQLIIQPNSGKGEQF